MRTSSHAASVGGVPLDALADSDPYRFGITAALAIAPTDRQFHTPTGPTVVPDSYIVIHGSKDSDVFTFEGYHTYERAHAVDLANPTVSDGKFKAMLWVHKANHNQFNSIWAPETPPGVAMPRPDQEQIAMVHIGAVAQAVLLDRKAYFAVLHDHAAAGQWDPPGTDLVSQYQDPERIFVQHNQEGLAPPVVSLPVQGTVAADGVAAVRQLTPWRGPPPPRSRFDWPGTLGSRLLLGGSGDAAGRALPCAVTARRPIRRTAQRSKSRYGSFAGGFQRLENSLDPGQFPAPATLPGCSAVRTGQDRDANAAAPGCPASRVRRGSQRPSLDRPGVRPQAGGRGLRGRFAILQLNLVYSR
jgi:hypothetical protein